MAKKLYVGGLSYQTTEDSLGAAFASAGTVVSAIVIKDKFSGEIIPPFCFGEGKAEKLRNFLSEKNLEINFKESFAYSDGVFDLPMLELVGNPVAVEPDKKLLEIAKNKGWQII